MVPAAGAGTTALLVASVFQATFTAPVAWLMAVGTAWQLSQASAPVRRLLAVRWRWCAPTFGLLTAVEPLVAELMKVKDSYNCDTLALAAGIAALEDQGWMLANAERVRSTRRRLTSELARLGFAVVPSQANFVWATHAKKPHHEIYDTLKQQKILVRLMRFPDVPEAPGGVVTGLRISIGTDSEIDTLLEALQEII